MWSLVHGFVMLTLDGHVGIDDKSKDRELLIQKILEFGSKVNDF